MRAMHGFGLVLATACRSRAQLSGVSTIVILSMSALGGSMFPRFMMSETLQRVGLVTFNAWANARASTTASHCCRRKITAVTATPSSVRSTPR